MKKIKFDQCNGLDNIIDSTGKKPALSNGMTVVLLINGFEVYVIILGAMKNSEVLPVNPSAIYGEIVKIEGTHKQNLDISIKDTVKFTRENIYYIAANQELTEI